MAGAAVAGLGVLGVAGTAHAAPTTGAQDTAQRMIDDAAQYQCFANIVERESGWDHTATNPSSGAYGLMQALPAGKMASAGSDWQSNPTTQIEWGLQYMEERYGSPCAAWSFWQNNHWY
ncbi:transglycosylase SLT domain-containing protein [Streptomyces alkaliphilus]|uniref:Transglycosylase SLT domain-containing protein n=2 Tax=Streptomyces alkaliphilus TaxID=1472722 RepID=A0A7W3TDP1_9ACTN|nr:transglycosylase SLT domain-containing protein [Streptomyces alkaliphilus]MBB0244635.1 transglycosylase SLT domain-containing protein [Streptomyces alkaliphilus]